MRRLPVDLRVTAAISAFRGETGLAVLLEDAAKEIERLHRALGELTVHNTKLRYKVQSTKWKLRKLREEKK